jgi:hypothetical protein
LISGSVWKSRCTLQIVEVRRAPARASGPRSIIS